MSRTITWRTMTRSTGKTKTYSLINPYHCQFLIFLIVVDLNSIYVLKITTMMITIMIMMIKIAIMRPIFKSGLQDLGR